MWVYVSIVSVTAQYETDASTNIYIQPPLFLLYSRESVCFKTHSDIPLIWVHSLIGTSRYRGRGFTSDCVYIMLTIVKMVVNTPGSTPSINKTCHHG